MPAENCQTCQLIAARDAGTAPMWDCIIRTEYWDVVHANDTSLLGWMCLVLRRHIAAVDELTEVEAGELGGLLRNVSAFLKHDRGANIFVYLNVADSERVTETDMNALAARLRERWGPLIVHGPGGER